MKWPSDDLKFVGLSDTSSLINSCKNESEQFQSSYWSFSINLLAVYSDNCEIQSWLNPKV